MGHKEIERRSRNTKYRGDVLIRAGRKMTHAQKKIGQKFNRDVEAGLGFIDDLPTGVITGRYVCWKGDKCIYPRAMVGLLLTQP
jgi:hypothetical protein